MGVVSSFCGAYNIRYDLMRLVARSGWAWYNGRSLGRRQAVRHWVLVPAFAGSNPADPAIFCAAKCGWGGRTRRASCRPSHFLCGKMRAGRQDPKGFLRTQPFFVRQNAGGEAGPEGLPADPATRSPETGIFSCAFRLRQDCEAFLPTQPFFVRKKRPRGARPLGGSPG